MSQKAGTLQTLTESASTLNLNFPTPRTVRHRYLLFISYSICGALYSNLKGLRQIYLEKKQLTSFFVLISLYIKNKFYYFNKLLNVQLNDFYFIIF